MKRFFVLAFAALLAVAATGVTVVAQQTQASPQAGAPAPQAGPSLAGDWSVSATGAKFRSGTYTLQQVNQQVIGKNPEGGQMQGTMKDPSTVEGTWRGPTGEQGWFNMHVAADGNSFSGQYGYGGRKPTGTLIGKRGAASTSSSAMPVPAPT